MPPTLPPETPTIQPLDFDRKNGGGPASYYDTQCPWCCRWFKGRRGLSAPAKMKRDACCTLLRILDEGVAARRAELQEARHALLEAEQAFRRDSRLKTYDVAVCNYVADHNRALRRARRLGRAELEKQAGWASSHLQHLGMPMIELASLLERIGLPLSQAFRIAAKGADLAAYWLITAS